MRRHFGQLVVASFCLVSSTQFVAAQGTTSTSDARAAVGPTLASAGAAVRWTPARVQTDSVLAPSSGALALAASRRSQSKILMIVGGAAVLTGAIAGGDAGTILIVGGAGFGLYGLYLYLQSSP